MTNQEAVPDALPEPIGDALVTSLYAKPATLAFGYLAHLLGSVTCLMLTHDVAFAYLAAFITVITAFRLLLARLYRTSRDKGFARGWDWEALYITGSSAGSGIVGLVAAYATAFHTESPAFAISLAMVAANMIGVVGRNFGSKLNIDFTVAAGLAPVAAAACFRGAATGQHWLFMVAALVVPMAVQSRQLSRHIHSMLLKSLFEHHRIEIKSKSFDASVNHMPNGLVLVGDDGNVLYANRKAMELKGYSPDANIAGMNFNQFVLLGMRASGAQQTRRSAEFFVTAGGTLELETDDGRWLEFQSEAFSLATELAPRLVGESVASRVVIIEDVTARVNDARKITFAAYHDNLTGLPNRHHMATLVEEHLANLADDDLVAVCAFDVDRFKVINDTLGHHVGDKVIEGVAERLKSIGFRDCSSARWGGDEFVVLLSGVSGEAEVVKEFDELFGRLCSTFVIQNENVEVRCSGGVAIRSKRDFDLHQDIAKADMALYKVKRNPNKAWALFTEDMESEWTRVMRIKHDLKEAITSGALEVVYQPIHEVRSNAVRSCEALCRWKHDEAGFISPTEFIPLAEEIGFITKLTEYVLRTACSDAAAWEHDVGVSVNLSAIDLWRDDIVALIREVLRDTGLKPARLCIELTESVFVKDHRRTADVLQAIRDLGVKTSIDDFGTLYSSLSYLHKLPMDRVKIDRSFIADITDDPVSQKLFKGVVRLSKELDFDVIVEGVETWDQARLIRQVDGVDMIQGFFLAEAMGRRDIAKRIRESHPQLGSDPNAEQRYVWLDATTRKAGRK